MKTPVMYWLIVVLQFTILVCSGNRVYEMTDCSESEELYCRKRNQYCCGSEICCTQREHSTLRDHGYFSPKLLTHGQKELIPILAINDKKSVKHSQNSRKNIMLDMRHIDPFFKRSESDRELMNSRSDRNGIEGNQPHHSFLSLSRLSFLSLLELLGFFMLAIFIVCGLICACCPAPLCYKEGTIFRRRGPARRENDSFEQDQNSASAARTAPSSSRFQSQFLQVSLPPGEFRRHSSAASYPPRPRPDPPPGYQSPLIPPYSEDPPQYPDDPPPPYPGPPLPTKDYDSA